MTLSPFNLLILVLVLINISAFMIMWLDKLRSQQGNSSRISEGLLFFMAATFASFGVYLGMFSFRHKTRKWYFIIGIPLLMAQNLASAYLIYLLIK